MVKISLALALLLLCAGNVFSQFAWRKSTPEVRENGVDIIAGLLQSSLFSDISEEKVPPPVKADSTHVQFTPASSVTQEHFDASSDASRVHNTQQQVRESLLDDVTGIMHACANLSSVARRVQFCLTVRPIESSDA